MKKSYIFAEVGFAEVYDDAAVPLNGHRITMEEVPKELLPVMEKAAGGREHIVRCLRHIGAEGDTYYEVQFITNPAEDELRRREDSVVWKVVPDNPAVLPH